jgi:uncharacterized low-complexity protein
MKKLNRFSLTTVIGAAVVSSFSATANAESSPFAMDELANGYMQAQAKTSTAAPAAATAKPAATTVAPAAAKTGGSCAEGKCGDMMNKPAAEKMAEAKCGESKCGAMMENGKMKQGMEMSCGAMMKGKEGACGDMMGQATAAAPAAKAAEMSCGGMMKGKEGSCGDMVKPAAAPAAKSAEGKCGESKCGAMMENGKMKKGMEASCGAMMKGKEGACGDMVKPAATANSAPLPENAPDHKLVEGQCAAVKEITLEKPKHDVSKDANTPWGNRKKSC